MAVLTVVQQPPKFQSAYKPLLVGVTSLRYPNTLPGEGANISTVKAATAADVSLLGNGLSVGDLMVTHGALIGVLVVGQAVTVDSLVYDGVFRVSKVISNSVTVIDSEYIEDTTGGRITKFYENYKLVAEVTMENQQIVPIKYDLEADAQSVFYLDASDAAQRTFALKDVFSIAKGGDPTAFIKANGYITQQWSVNFSEAYMVPDENGVNVYTEFGKRGAVASLSGKIAVNSVQPYHHIDEGDGTPDLNWMDDLDDYLIDPDVGLRQRFLTYAPRGGVSAYEVRNAVRLGQSDMFWLGILHSKSNNGTLNLRIVSYAQDGTQLQVDDVNYSVVTADSFIFDIGPDALGSHVNAAAHHYFVQMRNSLTGPYSERFYVTIDQQCNTARRFFFLNSFGAIDQYTIEGKESRENQVGREVVTKPNMALDLTTNRGDYQRRTYRVTPLRKYSATTRNESKEIVRWLGDEFFESVDVRTVIYDDPETIYTPVILETDTIRLNTRASRLPFQWSLGVDNQKQRR